MAPGTKRGWGEAQCGSPRIIVSVCTFRRNQALATLLRALVRNAEALQGRARVGVVVVDDNPDGAAREVCIEHEDSFELGLHYRTSGLGNIAVARNLGLETALSLADWIAMTDDDCVPVDHWLATYLDVLESTGATAVTGPCHLRAEGGPQWLTEQPFLQLGQFDLADGATMDVAATNNSIVDARFFESHPVRFDPHLGVVGGEDMVFFRSAHRQGLDIRYAADAVVHGIESPDRWTFRFQIRSKFWLGNTEFVTNQKLGDARPVRWFARGAKEVAMAALRPFEQLARRHPPQFRFALAAGARGMGMMAGACGVRVKHH